MILRTKNGGDLYYESCLGVFFRSSPLAVLEAEFEFNRGISEGLCLGEIARFYELLDLEPPEGAEEKGWNSEYLACDWGGSWVDFMHKPKISMSGEPYCEISYPKAPMPMDYKIDYLDNYF